MRYVEVLTVLGNEGLVLIDIDHVGPCLRTQPERHVTTEAGKRAHAHTDTVRRRRRRDGSCNINSDRSLHRCQAVVGRSVSPA